MPATTGANNARYRLYQQEEEEAMTGYTREELDNDWEFKIVRSYSMSTFRKPENLQRLIEEEAQAGWVMIEKFDDMRVRFKRPISARKRDAMLTSGIDPYRSIYGMGSAQLGALIAVVVILSVLLILGIVFAIVFSTTGVK